MSKFLVLYREPKFSENELTFCDTAEEAAALYAEYNNDLPSEGTYALEVWRLELGQSSGRGGVGL